MDEELGPVDQVSIYLHTQSHRRNPVNQRVNGHLLESSLIVPAQLDSLPHASWLVSPLNGLHVQIDRSLMLSDSGIATVGQRTGLSRTQTCHVVLIPTESVLSGPVIT